MSEMKHTVGPWIAKRQHHKAYTIKARGEVITDVFDGSVAISEANARLIAAAPELLQAVIDFLPMVKDLEDCGPPNEGWQSDELMKAIENARQALSKATGATQ